MVAHYTRKHQQEQDDISDGAGIPPPYAHVILDEVAIRVVDQSARDRRGMGERPVSLNRPSRVEMRTSFRAENPAEQMNATAGFRRSQASVIFSNACN